MMNALSQPSLVRLSVSLPAELFQELDAMVAERAVANRSQMIAELIRNALAEHNARPAGQCDCMPEDMDAYRAEMVRRIQTFLESRAKQDFKRPEAG